MDSNPHRANILDADVNEIGVGVYIDDDTLWVTQNFRHRPGSTPPPEPPAPPASPATPSPSSGDGGESTGGEGAGEAGKNATRNTTTTRPSVDPREVQRRLAALGWYAAEVDSVVGPMTREAVTAFHGAVGLAAEGQIRAATLAALTEADPPHRSAAIEVHPVFMVLDRVAAAQSS